MGFKGIYFVKLICKYNEGLWAQPTNSLANG